MKKIFCGILVLIMAVCFVACGSGAQLEENNVAETEENNVVESEKKVTPMLSSGFVKLGLSDDGTVLCDEEYAEYVKDWTDIVEISVSKMNEWAVGLKSDGTVVATSFGEEDKYGMCDVSDWTDIKDVAITLYQTIGVKSDGTCVVAGDDIADLSSWTNIVSVDGGSWGNVVGLKEDGTCVVAGNISIFDYGQGNVSDWTDLIDVKSGNGCTVGLKSDGTVVACGSNDDGECNVSEWTDIIDISAGMGITVGLKSDGTVVACGEGVESMSEISTWNDIIDVGTGIGCILGLKKDGTVVIIAGKSYYSDFFEWDLVK